MYSFKVRTSAKHSLSITLPDVLSGHQCQKKKKDTLNQPTEIIILPASFILQTRNEVHRRLRLGQSRTTTL